MVSDSICRRQWVESVGRFSSQFSKPKYCARKVVGMPTVYPTHGTNVEAWCPKTELGTEYIELNYRIPVYITDVNIYETFNAGGVIKIEGWNPETFLWKTLWSTKGPETLDFARVFSPDLSATKPFLTHRIKLTIESKSAWREIDAVEIQGYDTYKDTLFEPIFRKMHTRCQWVDEVMSFSTQLDTGNFAANQLIGPTKVYPKYGHNAYTWAQATKDGNQFVEVKFSVPVHPVKLRFYETQCGGGIVKIEGFNSKTKDYETLWTGHMNTYRYANVFEALLKVPNTLKYNQFKVWLDCSQLPSEYREIDAIELVGTDELEKNPPKP